MSRITIAAAKQLDLVDYLASLGFQPEKVRNQDYWYRSPLREEKTASFKVNRTKRLWYDHGTGQGGTIIDFGMAYFRCDLREFLKRLDQGFSFHLPLQSAVPFTPAASQPSDTPAGEKKKLVVLAAGPLVSPVLTSYLASRTIPLSIAAVYCREVTFELSGKCFFAIGFKNDLGGFELRNAHFKGSSAPKASTFFDQGYNELAVFEGFFNFLSFLTLNQYRALGLCNFLVLNSLTFFQKNIPLMEQHKGITLYLDRDTAGIQCTQQAMKLGPQFHDGSQLYAESKDLNDWLIQNFSKLKQEHFSLRQAGKMLRGSDQPPPGTRQTSKRNRL
ncbi:CHC2 zinc finger [Chitinophaga eiseniae]|uniref:CHC2 zinc finger n=1 Tax=Chitinophaga eiseniae TaxID=634771 RepID=A0A1T4RC47_9BACT|nr:toprim domain-containing protein [Chitinophaga eiseniae]SKA13543.1 CHC2 zinc finger [Chitinophaga eiseniae]